MLKKISGLAGLLAALLMLAGCDTQTNQTYSLNPDGSGKVEIDITKGPQMGYDKASMPPIEKRTADEVTALLTKAKGVDTWKGVTITPMEDGARFHITGTAYFSDVNKLEISNVVLAQINYSNKKGAALVMLKMKSKNTPGKMKKADATARADRSIEQWNKQMKPAMETGMAKTDIHMTFLMPGGVAAVNGFAKKGNSASIHVEGPKLFKAIDTMQTDKKAIVADNLGGTTKNTEAVLYKGLTGKPNPISAATKGKLKPLFDYKKEMDEAKAAYPEMAKALGVTAP